MSTPDERAADLAGQMGADEPPMGANGEHKPPEAEQPKKEKNKGGRPPSSGSWIAKLMGSAEKAIIKKRNDDGSLALCGEYSQEDIGRATTMELFIKNYIVPQYGYGKYRVYALRDGNLLDMGQHDVLAPAGVNPSMGMNAGDPAAAFHAMTDVQIKLQQEAESRATRAKEQAQVEFDNMMKAAAMISGKDKGGGMDPMMMMMFMQMMQRQQPAPSHDTSTSAIQALQSAFQTALDQSKSNMAPMPPMMPPMPMDQGPNIAEIMSTIAQVMKPQGPSAMEQILIGLVPTLPALLMKKDEGFKLSDFMGALPMIIPLIKQMTGADEIGDLKAELRAIRDNDHKRGGIMETLQEFRALREVANEMAPQAPAGESFFQFARDLIQSLPETADAVGDLMLKISASKDTKKIGGGKNRPALEEPEEETVLKYPDGFVPFVTRIAESKDDGEYVGNTLKAFQFLGKDKEWQKYLSGMLVRAKGGDKEEVLDFVKSFLEGVRDGGLLDKKSCEAAVGAFQRNIDKVIDWAQGIGRKREKAAAPAPTPDAPAPEVK